MRRRGVDTNVLIYAHMPGLPHHDAVRSFLLDQLSTDEVSLVVTPAILHELVHVVTDGRRFDPPVSMAVAIALAQVYLEHANVECSEHLEPLGSVKFNSDPRGSFLAARALANGNLEIEVFGPA